MLTKIIPALVALTILVPAGAEAKIQKKTLATCADSSKAVIQHLVGTKGETVASVDGEPLTEAIYGTFTWIQPDTGVPIKFQFTTGYDAVTSDVAELFLFEGLFGMADDFDDAEAFLSGLVFLLNGPASKKGTVVLDIDATTGNGSPVEHVEFKKCTFNNLGVLNAS